MKKFLLTIVILMFSQTAFALGELCPSTYELTGGFKRFTSRISGENLVYTRLLEHALEKQAEKELGGKVKIKIKSFSASDLKEGKFQSLHAIGNDISLENLSVSRLELKSICDYNQIQKGTSAYNFITDFPANVKLELSADNINKITQTTDYKKIIKEVNSNLNGFLTIKNINFDIENDKLVYNIDFVTPFASKIQQVKIKTDVAYNNGKTNIYNGQTDAKKSILRYLLLSNALNYINPLDFSAKIIENNTAETDINQIYINDNKIMIDTVINIRK